MASNIRLINTNDLALYDGKLKNWVKSGFSLRTKSTTTSGYAKTYELIFTYAVKDPETNVVSNTELSMGEIDIPKDFLVRNADVKTAVANDGSGITAGKKYIDLEINVKAYEGETDAFDDTGKPTASASTLGKIYLYTGATDATYTNGNYYVCAQNGSNYEWQVTTVAEASHIRVPLDDLMNYTGGNGIDITNGTIAIDYDGTKGLTLTGATDGSKKLGVKVDTATGLAIDETNGIQINNGNGIDFSSNKVVAKTNTNAGIDVDSNGIKAVVSDNLEFDANGKIDVKAQKASSASDSTNPAIGGIDQADYRAFKGAADLTQFNKTVGNATAGTASGNVTPYTKTITITGKNTEGTANNSVVSFDIEWKEYGNATATSGQTAGAAGLMSGTDKDALDALVTALGTDVIIAEEADINSLFPTVS